MIHSQEFDWPLDRCEVCALGGGTQSSDAHSSNQLKEDKIS